MVFDCLCKTQLTWLMTDAIVPRKLVTPQKHP